MSEPELDVVRAYKEVIGELTAATEALRERDRQQAVVLERRLADLAKVAADAEGRAALVRFGAELQWESVLDALWEESWMLLRPHPRPDPDADPADLDTHYLDTVRAADELRAAVRRRTFGLGR